MVGSRAKEESTHYNIACRFVSQSEHSLLLDPNAKSKISKVRRHTYVCELE